jgi:DNA-directed RNA polymerase subunit E'/Rpb7
MSIQVIISLKRLSRDRLVKELGLELIVRNVQDAIDEGKVVERQVSILAEIVFKPLRFWMLLMI